jgi:hypothetical protein
MLRCPDPAHSPPPASLWLLCIRGIEGWFHRLVVPVACVLIHAGMMALKVGRRVRET